MRLTNLRDLLRQRAAVWGPTASPPEAVVLALEADVFKRAPRIVDLVNQGTPKGYDELDQFVIGFGLRPGFRPLVGDALHPTDWDGVWPKAAQWLYQRVWGAMWAVSRYLEFSLIVQGYAFQHHPELSIAVAQTMTTWLIEGGCECSRLALPGTPNGGALWNFMLRVARCRRQHSLAGWDPQRTSLHNFVSQAVKGSRGKQGQMLRPGALVQGMHFYNLYFLSNLRFEDVLVWVCPVDGAQNFEGLPCLTCWGQGRGALIPHNAWRTVVRRLVVPEKLGGRYGREHYYNCQHCKKLKSIDGDRFFPRSHYYPADQLVCPKCGFGRSSGAKRSSVYVLRPTTISLEVMRGQISHPGTDDDNSYASENCLEEDNSAIEDFLNEPHQDFQPDEEPAPLAEEMQVGDSQASVASRAQLEAAVAKLPVAQRRLIQLMYLSEHRLLLQEAAQVMGIPLAKALLLLRKAGRALTLTGTK